MAKKSGLGKGLDALFLDNETAESSSLMTLRVSDIEPNKDQPRKAFEPNALAELADSIREHGILQPVVVRALPGGVYQIIAGERRWRASRMAGLSEIPAIVIEADDAKVRERARCGTLRGEALAMEADVRELRRLRRQLPGAGILLADCGMSADARALAAYLADRTEGVALTEGPEIKLG